MISREILQGPKLKVQRANTHIDELTSLTDPLSQNLYTIKRNPLPPYANTFIGDLTYEPTKPIGETLALVIGDALHNLRGALDHLATGIARSQIHYPMVKKREDLLASTVGKKIPGFQRSLNSLDTALPGAKDLILNEIRPLNSPDEKLWSFHTLNNDDKHNLLIPTVTVTQVLFSATAINGSASFQNCAAVRDATKPMVFFSSSTPFTLDRDIETNVSVKFGDGTPFKDYPVIPTLAKIAELVTKTIDGFERLISAQVP